MGKNAESIFLGFLVFISGQPLKVICFILRSGKSSEMIQCQVFFPAKSFPRRGINCMLLIAY